MEKTKTEKLPVLLGGGCVRRAMLEAVIGPASGVKSAAPSPLRLLRPEARALRVLTTSPPPTRKVAPLADC
eukprot:1839925-Amphidinium_carterae.1